MCRESKFYSAMTLLNFSARCGEAYISMKECNCSIEIIGCCKSIKPTLQNGIHIDSFVPKIFIFIVFFFF